MLAVEMALGFLAPTEPFFLSVCGSKGQAKALMGQQQAIRRPWEGR